MALVSYGFGFFCAVLLLLYYIVPGRFQWRILLAASVLFYGFAGPLWILYPAASSVSVWYLARKIGSMTDQYRNWVQKEQPDRTQKKAYNQRLKARQKRFLILGLLLNFGILAILKYTNFLLSNVEGILSLMLGGYGTLMDTPDLMILGLGVLFMALAGQICGNEGLKERLSRLPWPVSYGLSFVLFLILLVTGVYGRGYEASQFIYNRF